MPAPDRNVPVDPMRYIAHGITNADQRNTRQEHERGMSGWVTATLLGDFAPPELPKIPFRYRLHFKTNSLELDGYIDVTTAVSGDICAYLEQPFWRPYDISYPTTLITGDSGTYSIGHVFIDSADGAITVSW